jgi:hypothetical protein
LVRARRTADRSKTQDADDVITENCLKIIHMATAHPIQIRFERFTGDTGIAPAKPPRLVSQAEKPELIERAKRLLKEREAVLVAHYYVHPDLQDLAQSSGGTVSDSLEMARFGHEHKGKTVVVAGVRFMGETAKILNPEKQVLIARSRHARRPVRGVLRQASRSRRRGLRQHERGGEGARGLDGDFLHRREDRRISPPAGKENPLGAGQAPGRLRA